MRGSNNNLIAFLRSLPPYSEFAIVNVVAFGMFIVQSFAEAIHPSQYAAASAFPLSHIAVFEVMVGVVLALFLYVRGWRLTDLGFFRLTWRDGTDALALMAACYAVSMTLWIFVGPTLRPLAPGDVDSAGVSDVFALTFSLINATFEEVFVCAYVLAAWRGPSMWSAITASAGIRLGYHLYQGPVGALSIGPLGLIFGWYYATRGRIGPLIAAHALFDFLYLVQF